MKLKAGDYWGPLSDILITSEPVPKHSVEFVLGNNLAVRARKQYLNNLFCVKILINTFMYGIPCSCPPSSAAHQFEVANPAQISLPILSEHLHPSLAPGQPWHASLGRQNGWQDTDPW